MNFELFCNLLFWSFKLNSDSFTTNLKYCLEIYRQKCRQGRIQRGDRGKFPLLNLVVPTYFQEMKIRVKKNSNYAKARGLYILWSGIFEKFPLSKSPSLSLPVSAELHLPSTVMQQGSVSYIQ